MTSDVKRCHLLPCCVEYVMSTKISNKVQSKLAVSKVQRTQVKVLSKNRVQAYCKQGKEANRNAAVENAKLER